MGAAVDTPASGAKARSARQRGRVAAAAVRPPPRPMMHPDKQGRRESGGELEGFWSAHWVLCACGYKVRCEVARYGECLSELIFFDDSDASMTRGERVRHCPGCQRFLSLSILRS